MAGPRRRVASGGHGNRQGPRGRGAHGFGSGGGGLRGDRIAQVENGLLSPVTGIAFSIAEMMEFHSVPGVCVAVINGFEIEWARRPKSRPSVGSVRSSRVASMPMSSNPPHSTPDRVLVGDRQPTHQTHLPDIRSARRADRRCFGIGLLSLISDCLCGKGDRTIAARSRLQRINIRTARR